MASPDHPFILPLLLVLSISTLCFVSHAKVPASDTFKFVNSGELGWYITEYFPDYRPLDLSTSPFQLCFYNHTPNAFTLALRMGTTRSTSLRRWVWEANRGNPVGENATLTFGTDGNLVLADADGRVAWQTGTANKGVVGLKLLPTGNMVLHDSKGSFLWQSFDYPTDTLLVGQSLRMGGPTKLVSRASVEQNSDGPFSLVLEPKGWAMYYKSPNSPKPLLYFSSSEWFTISKGGKIDNMTFTCEVDPDEGYASDLTLRYGIEDRYGAGQPVLARPKYNSSLSYLRLGIDGNLKFHTYSPFVTWSAWENPFTLFSRDSDISECQLPERCGKFGLCEDSQCVACPSPNGLLGWSKDCEPVKVPSCRPGDFGYYELNGVDHFTIKYTRGDGPAKQEACEGRCTRDCKCMGYFYHKDTSRCWIAYDLKTLTRVGNSSHVAYIKKPSH